MGGRAADKVDWADPLPAGMDNIERLLKEPVVQRQGVGVAFLMSHFD